MKKLLLILIGVFLFANTLFDDGVLYFKEKKYQKAYDVFVKLSKKFPAKTDVNIMLGVTAEKLKKYNVAVAAFERVLIYHPENKEAKYLLGKLYLKMKRYYAAMTMLKGLKYKDAYKYYLVSAALVKRHYFDMMFSVGYVYDSNVNNVTDDKYGIYIGDVYLQAVTDKKSDSGIKEIFALNHRYFNENFLYEDKFFIYNKNYFKEDSGDITVFSYMPKLTVNKYRGYLILNHIILDHKNYLTKYGIGFGYDWMDVTALRKDYNDLKDRNYFSFKISPKKMFLNPFLKIAVERGDGFESNINSLKIGGNYRKSIFDCYFSYEAKNYLDENYLFQKKRKDRILDLRLSATKKVKNVYLSVSGEYLKNNSNIPADDYDKKIFSVSITIPFKG